MRYRATFAVALYIAAAHLPTLAVGATFTLPSAGKSFTSELSDLFALMADANTHALEENVAAGLSSSSAGVHGLGETGFDKGDLDQDGTSGFVAREGEEYQDDLAAFILALVDFNGYLAQDTNRQAVVYFDVGNLHPIGRNDRDVDYDDFLAFQGILVPEMRALPLALCGATVICTLARKRDVKPHHVANA